MAAMTPAQIDAELKRKAAAGIAPTNAANQAKYNELRSAQQAATNAGMSQSVTNEVKRKAEMGIGLTNPTADKQAIYDDIRKKTEAEIQRKATAGIGLTNTSSDANNLLYEQLKNAHSQSYGQGETKDPNSALPSNQTSQTAPPTTPGNETARDYIAELTEARRREQIAQLEKSRQEALSNLQGEKAAIAPMYYDQRNQVAAGSQRAAKNLAEYMAARGGTSSGVAAQAEISRNMSLQGNLGTLGRQEASALQDIERRTTGVNNAFASDKTAIESGLQADKMNKLLNDYYIAQERGDRLSQLAIENEFQRAGLTGYLNGQRTLQGQGLDMQRDFGTSDRTGYLNGSRTIQGQSFDRDVLESDRAYDYQLSRDKVQDSQWQQSFQYQQTQDKVAQQQWQSEFDYNKVMNDKKLAQDAQQFAKSQGLQWANLNQREKEFAAQEAWNKKQYDDEQAWKQKEYDLKLKEYEPASSGMDEYDMSILEDAFVDAGYNLKTASPDEIKKFTAGMKSQYGWTTEEAQQVDKYLSSKVYRTRYGGPGMIAMGVRG